MGEIKKSDYVPAKSGAVWVLLLGVVATTIYFQTKFFDPFNTPKLMILLIVSAWLLGHVINTFRIHKTESNLLYMRIIAIPVLFIVSMSVALLMSDRFIVALIGDVQRRNGFLAYLGLTILLIFSARSFNFQYANRLIRVSILVGLILSFYGVMQVNKRDFVAWDSSFNPMLITLGNPNFASSMLAILTILALHAIFLNKLNIIYKIAALPVIVMSMYSINSSQSRQGFLVIAVGIISFLLIYSYSQKVKYRFIVYVSGMGIFLISILDMLQRGPFQNILYKDSVSVRGYYWRAALQMIQDYPLAGVGLDNYGSFFKQYRESQYPLRYGFTLTSSNAHNTFLQLFSTGGLFVGGTYFLMIVSILIIGIKLVKKVYNDERKIVIILISAWLGFQAQSLISIDNIGISVWGWLLGGAILGLFYTISAGEKWQVSLEKARVPQRVWIFQPLISTCFLIPAVAIAIPLYQMEMKSNMIRGLVASENEQDKSAYVGYSNEIINSAFADPSYKFLAARSLVNAGLLEKSYQEIYKLHQSDLRNLEHMAWLAEYSKSRNDVSGAILYRKEIAKLDPWNVENLLYLGNLYKENGDFYQVNAIVATISSFASNHELGQIAKESLG
jgi:O-antigen ligase